MKRFALFFVAAAVATSGALGNAWAQTTTESETITTAPSPPSVTTRYVTTRTVVNPPADVVVSPPQAVVVNPPPAVVINPPPAISSNTTTTTQTTRTEESASADDEEGAPVLGSAVNGNTTIVFRAADSRDIHMSRLQTWDEFAAAHPRIARTLQYKPWLINDPGYLSRHPALQAFFIAHPDVKIAMAEDPGNFNAIPPRPGE